MKKRVGTLLTAVGLSLITMVGISTATMPQAQAETVRPMMVALRCYDTGALTCWYNNTNYTGSSWFMVGDVVNGNCQLSSLTSWNNVASSIWNNRTTTQYAWVNQNFTGSQIILSPQAGRATLASPFNKNLESWKGYCSLL